jgi:hypothetical protein
MATSVLVDAGFLVALLSRRDTNHRWAAAEASRHKPPWITCEAPLSEAFHLLGAHGTRSPAKLLGRGAIVCDFLQEQRKNGPFVTQIRLELLVLRHKCLLRLCVGIRGHAAGRPISPASTIIPSTTRE